MKTICLDFDGVIHKYSKKFHDGTIYDEPMQGTKESMKKLMDNGYRIIISTCRPNEIVDIADWLQRKGLQCGVHFHEITKEKPKAFAYVDDRAIRFTNWKDILNYFV